MDQTPEQLEMANLRRIFRDFSANARRTCDLNRVERNYDDAKMAILATELERFLENNTEKKVKLFLCDNSFGPAGCRSLVSVLTNFPSQIVRLDLSNTMIVDQGARIIAKALETNDSIKTLVLHNTGIDTGIESIGDMLKVNKRITTLDVEENHFLVIKSSFTIPESLYRLADGYAQHPTMDLIFTEHLQVRLEFVRLVIQVEVPGTRAVDLLLRHEDEQNNSIINRLIHAWRKCRDAGEKCFVPTDLLYTQIEEYQQALIATDEAKYQRIEQQAAAWIDQQVPAAPKIEGGIRAKLVFVGDKDSGKSSLLNSLGAVRPSLTREGENTICANIKRVKVKGVDCAVYEVGGHKAFKGVPTLFMSPKSVAIIVVRLDLYNPNNDREFEKKVKKWLSVVRYHIDKANIFVVGTHADRVLDPDRLQSRTEHIRDNLRRWMRERSDLMERNTEFFMERVNGNIRRDDIPQIDWIEEYIPRPHDRNVFLDAHNPNNVPYLPKSESESHFPGKTLLAFSDNCATIRYCGEGANENIFVTGARDCTGVEQFHERLGELLVQDDRVHTKLTAKEAYLASELQRIGQNPNNRVVLIEDLMVNQEKDMAVLADLLVDMTKRNPIMKALFQTRNNKLFDNITELKQALEKLHSVGHILWYSKCQSLNNWVFLSPQWVADMIGRLIRYDAVKKLSKEDRKRLSNEIQRFKEEAVIPIALLHSFEHWKDAGAFQCEAATKLLNELDLLCWAPQRGVLDAYFVPFQLYNKNLDVQTKPFTLPPVPRSLERLVPAVSVGRGKFKREYYHKDAESLEGRHLQYQFLCVNGFAEGVFCRFLARIQPYVDLDFSTLSKMGVVARSPTGCKFLIEEHKFYYRGWNRKVLKEGGALLITGLQEIGATVDFMNTMALMSEEVDRMVNNYTGILSGVFIAYMDLRSDKLVVAQRRRLEHWQTLALTSKQMKTREMWVYVEGEDGDKVEKRLDLLIPEAVTRISTKFSGRYLQPICQVRNSYFGKAQIVLTNVNSWLREMTGRNDNSRLKIIHLKLAQVLESLLQYCANGNNTGQSGYPVYCKNLESDKSVPSLERPEKQVWKHVERIYQAGAETVTLESNENLLDVCRALLQYLEEKAINREFNPVHTVLGGYVNAG